MSDPDRMSMEGMILNADRVLEKAQEATKPGKGIIKGIMGIPKELFENCKGLCLLEQVEAGFIFSGNVGTGIILAKKKDGSGWSKPAACGITGVNWGFLAGLSHKECMIFIMDDASMDGLTSENGLKAGGQLELTLGPWGRAGKFELGLGGKGGSGTVTIAITQGIFGALSVAGAVIGARDAVNTRFYGQECTTRRILFEDDIEFPSDKETKMSDVYTKLDELSAKAESAEEKKEEKEEDTKDEKEEEKEDAAKSDEKEEEKEDVAKSEDAAEEK